MESNTLPSDNELIAQFMGMPLTKKMPSFGSSEWVEVPFQNWKYNSSWDWLMPVVEKIEDKLSEKGASATQGWYYWNNVFDGYVNTDINVTYESVTGFIKWYNQQTPKP